MSKTRVALANKVKSLADACQPSCAKAMEEYNATTPLKIVVEEMKIGFNLDKNELHLSVWMRDSSGREPDEEFDFSDIERIESALRPILNRELEQAHIPFTFGKISVPSSYYMK